MNRNERFSLFYQAVVSNECEALRGKIRALVLLGYVDEEYPRRVMLPIGWGDLTHYEVLEVEDLGGGDFRVHIVETAGSSDDLFRTEMSVEISAESESDAIAALIMDMNRDFIAAKIQGDLNLWRTEVDFFDEDPE